ncbi:hypothetical protein D770_01435 [Flammeovirgaceae bacterium 311]|nr:hypothetical protein D770_01435 [Flammeovirgaceae bacterium 311]
MLKNARVVKEGIWLNGFSLYSAGWYPLAVRDAAAKIIGDVVMVPDAIWPQLDAYEGEDYKRVYLEQEGVWIYLFRHDPTAFPKIAAGDWLTWWAQQ